MDIKLHPDPATLMTCAAGSQPEALCAVVSSHLSMCVECLEEIERMEQIGMVLLSRLDASPMNSPPAETNGHGGPSGSKIAPSPSKTALEMPAPLRDVVGTDFDNLVWQTTGPGIESYVVPMSPSAEGELILVKLAPGRILPARPYDGEQLLVILRGSCTHDASVLQRGDYIELFDHLAPNILADRNDGCTLLIAYERLPH